MNMKKQLIPAAFVLLGGIIGITAVLLEQPYGLIPCVISFAVGIWSVRLLND
jgi:hypothetical protein